MYMFTIQQEIPGRGKRDLRAALAEKEVEQVSADVAVRARDVVKDVMRAYADLVIARRATEIHLASVDVLRQFADASTLKYSAGKSSQHDVLKSVVELSRVHEDLVMHQESAAMAAARLNTLLDRDPETPIGPLDEPRDEIALPASADLQRLALQQQPELRGAQLSVERAQAALAVATRERKPDFFVGGGYMLTPREAGAWTASVGMTWPNAPWSRGRLDAQQSEATASYSRRPSDCPRVRTRDMALGGAAGPRRWPVRKRAGRVMKGRCRWVGTWQRSSHSPNVVPPCP